jgi:hypothetical protein
LEHAGYFSILLIHVIVVEGVWGIINGMSWLMDLLLIGGVNGSVFRVLVVVSE